MTGRIRQRHDRKITRTVGKVRSGDCCPSPSIEIDDITTITDQATVNITTTTGTNSTDGVGVDAGIFEVGAEETHGTTTTRTSHTSRPGDGGFQNDEDLHDALDAATIRPEVPSVRA